MTSQIEPQWIIASINTTDAGRLSLGTQRGSPAHAKGVLGFTQDKNSNASQQEVIAEFTEHTERADTDGISGKLRNERSMSFISVQGFY